MLCPTCNAELPDDTERCPYCNTMLYQADPRGSDPYGAAASYEPDPHGSDPYGSAPSYEDPYGAASYPPPHPHGSGAHEDPHAPPWGDPHASGVDVFTSAQGTGEQVAAGPPGSSQAHVHTRIVSVDPEQERGTRIVEVSVPQVVRRSARQEGQAGRASESQGVAGLGQGVDDLFDTIKLSYARMHRLDRITMWITVVALVGAFLPWRYTYGEGLIAGIQGLGAASAGCAALVLLCIYTRTVRRRLSGALLSLQVLAAGGITAVPVFVFLWQTGTSAKFGLYIAALGGAAAIFATLARLAVRNV